MENDPALTRQTANMRWYLQNTFRKNDFRWVNDDTPAIQESVSDPTTCSPLQRDVIVAVIEGHDVFLQASTSFGKSLCYQLPAVLKDWGCEYWIILHLAH
jgi:superfamily II DNA helicase RecQ